MIGTENATNRGPAPWRRWLLLVAMALAVGVAVVAMAPAVRDPVLRAVGRSLVVDEPIGPADVVVVSLDSGGAGALEAADLVRSGIARRVAVFADPPSGEDHEFIRRGLPYEDAAARQVRQLGWLGVADVDRIPRLQGGTEGEGQVLGPWCTDRGFRSIVLVVTADHSRRMRRVADRAMEGRATRVAIRPSRYSAFDPETWWQSRDGMRIGIVEFEKLLLDYLLHPLSI